MKFIKPARHRLLVTYRAGFLLLGMGFMALAGFAQTSENITLSNANFEKSSGLVRQAELIVRTRLPGSLEKGILLFQTAANDFHQTGEFEAEALAWHRISVLSAKLGFSPQAKAASEKALMILRFKTLSSSSAISAIGKAQAARAHLSLGRIYLETGDPQQALKSYYEGLGLALEARLSREAAAAHVAIGLLAAQAGEFDIAIQMTANSLEFWRSAKDFDGEAMSLNNLARFFERKGDLDRAAEADDQAIKINRIRRNTTDEQSSLMESKRINLILGNYEAAAYASEQLAGIAKLNKDRKKEGEHLISLAMIEAQRDNLTTAYQLLLKALIVSNEKDTNQQISEVKALLENRQPLVEVDREQLLALAELETERKDFAAAYQLLLKALVVKGREVDVKGSELNTRIKVMVEKIEVRQKREEIKTR